MKMNSFKGSMSLSPRMAEVAKALCVTSGIFSFVLFSAQAAANVVLTVQVQQYLNFTATTGAGDEFGSLVPGTPVFATTTLTMITNDAHGWTTSLSADNKTATNRSLQLIDPANPAQYLTRDPSLQIADKTTFVAAGATTTAANASVLAGTENVLAFRVMTASSSNGASFYAPTWWGTDNAAKIGGSANWAGIPSSTAPQIIGNAGYGSFSGATPHINTVQYYLNVGMDQETGNYSAPVTYTTTGTI